MNDLAQWTTNTPEKKKTPFWENLPAEDHVFMQQVIKTGGMSENIPDFLKWIDKLLSPTVIILPADSWVGGSPWLGI